MAAIDKIYAKKEEREIFLEWCKKNYPQAVKYFYDWAEEWTDGKDHPITNFPTWVDKYLYKCCPIKFVHDTIFDQYGEDEKFLFKLDYRKKGIGKPFEKCPKCGYIYLHSDFHAPSKKEELCLETTCIKCHFKWIEVYTFVHNTDEKGCKLKEK